VEYPGWGGVLFGGLKAQYTGMVGGGTSYDKIFIVDVLCSLVRGPPLLNAVEESRMCELVLRFADKLSLRGKSFPTGLWENLCLGRSGVGDTPGEGVRRYDMCMNTCAKRQQAGGVWLTGGGSGARGAGGGRGRGAWGGRGDGNQGGGGGGKGSPGGGK